MKKEPTYMQVITGADGDAGEILLYGYIGQDLWWDKEEKEKSITDIEFRRAFNELAAQKDRINIRINSPGGSLFHGNAIVSTIMNAKGVEVHGYNDGMAASMAASIFLACPNRHMGVNATMMLHSTINIAVGNAKDMRMMADTLDKFTSTTAAMIAKVTDMDEEEVNERFFNNYEDHWLTRKECVEIGFVNEKDEYENEPVIDPEQAMQMDYSDLVAQFTNMENKVRKSPWWRRAAAVFSGASDNQTDKDMKVEDLKASLKSGELTAEEVQNILSELQTEDPEQNGDNQGLSPEEDNEARLRALEVKIENLAGQWTQAVKNIETQLEQIGDKPGAKPAQAQADADIETEEDEDDLQQQYRKDLEAQAKAAEKWENPFSGYIE